MGIRGELFSTKVSLQNRTYFFNVKENRMGDLYLNIVESKNRESGGFERQSVILFADDLREFLTGFDESLKVLEKAEREKRKGDKPKSFQSSHANGRKDREGPKDQYSGTRAARHKPSGDRPPPRDRPSSRDRSPPRDRPPSGDRAPGGRSHGERSYGDRARGERQQQKPRKRVIRKRD